MPRQELLHQRITGAIIDSFDTVYAELGYGYREYVYALALERELTRRGHKVEREVWVTIYFTGEPLCRERMDMLVDGKVIVENKTGPRLPPNPTQQLFGYLCASTKELGMFLFYGPKPQFFRVICQNHFKHHQPSGRPSQ